MSGLKRLGRQLSRYSAIGVLNTLVGGALIYLAHNAFGLGVIVSNVIGYGAGLTLSYFGNKYWTFGDTSRSAVAPMIFAALVAVAFSSNLGITFGLIAAGLSFNIAQFFGIVTYSAIVFLGMKFLLFSERKN